MATHAAPDMLDGDVVLDREGATVRCRTEQQVPVPSVRDALGQHIVARVIRRAGYPHLPPYHPDRRLAGQEA